VLPDSTLRFQNSAKIQSIYRELRVRAAVSRCLNVWVKYLKRAETVLLSAQEVFVACERGFPAPVDAGNDDYRFNGAGLSKKSVFWNERRRTFSGQICA